MEPAAHEPDLALAEKRCGRVDALCCLLMRPGPVKQAHRETRQEVSAMTGGDAMAPSLANTRKDGREAMMCLIEHDEGREEPMAQEGSFAPGHAITVSGCGSLLYLTQQQALAISLTSKSNIRVSKAEVRFDYPGVALS